ncbi:MAG: DNA-processing protein DprA [Clostridia bacterium]|nr:DNA-processing protein DprA [Clostridia bacterium]
MTENALYTLWLILAGKQGTAKTYRLIQAMEAKEAYHATKAELIPPLGEKDAFPFLNKDLRAAREVLDDCREKGIDIICYHDEAYPSALREIHDPPPALFVLGNFPDPNKPVIGVVGTRKCSANAAAMAATFSCSLALSGFQIVSGMANGIDTYAHKGSLIKGKASFAVLGCGVDVVYPKANQVLYDLLREHGGLISEYLPGTPPRASNFPKRNRIISGLSEGVLVVECPEKSGSMITARLAIEQNRLLFALPSNPYDRVNTGTNQLIKHGAIFCTEPGDICNEFLPRYQDRITPITVRFEPAMKEPSPSAPPREKSKKEPKKAPPISAPPPPLSEEETVVYRSFSDAEVLSADEICQRTGLIFPRLLPLLQALELSGCIESLPGSMFRRK